MFQNTENDLNNDTKEETIQKRNILTNALSKKYILLYIISFMVSTIGLGQVVSPCALAILAAVGANEIPIIIVLGLSFIGNIIGCGPSSILPYIITILLFFLSFFVKEPKYNEESRNEKIKFGRRIFVATLIIGTVRAVFSGFLIYDFLVAISMSMLTFILYKIFANSITVLLNIFEKRAFTFEEIIGAGVLLTIAVCALGNINIFGFSIRNIIAIFIVLLLGWKHGMLVGATTGITIGVTLGIVAGAEPIIIGAYAISGLIAGVLNRFGKIGVIVGFVVGDIILTYLSNGGLENLIVFQEILIAGIGLLAVPKNIKLNIEDVIGKSSFLPVGADRRLSKSETTNNTAERLKKVSKIVQEMAKTYNKSAEVVEDEQEAKLRNKDIFISELLNSIDDKEENILYDNLSDTNGNIVNDIYEKLLQKQFITEKELIEIFANNNNYIVGFKEDKSTVGRDVEKMTRAINASFKISKMNFVYNAKLNENKKNVGTQLNTVSKAISEIAEDIKKGTKIESKYSNEKKAIIRLLKEKEIVVEDIEIEKQENERINIYINIEQVKKSKLDETIKIVLEKTLNENMKIVKQEKNEEQKTIDFKFVSDDKFFLEVGQAIAIKDGQTVSGDTVLYTKLQDEKYLLAISDGMGSGPEARKSSQVVIKMLKRLLDSGFNKKTSIDLINSELLNIGEEIYATLDIAIIDLYKGTIEFIKNGCAPTYIKNNKKVQIIKSSTLPTGIVKDINTEVTEKDLQDGDLILMCSDGAIDSNVEYKNKPLWIKYLLEDIQNTNAQKVADLTLNEAIDNNYGNVKDDISILTCKIVKKV